MLITSAEDFVESMGWTEDKALSEAQEAGIERQLFVDLSDDEQKIVNALKEENDMQANVIATKLGMEISKVSASLFSLELNGMIKNVAGNIYHLL
jgi:DNA processing protein